MPAQRCFRGYPSRKMCGLACAFANCPSGNGAPSSTNICRWSISTDIEPSFLHNFPAACVSDCKSHGHSRSSRKFCSWMSLFGALDALTRRRMHSVLLAIWERTGKTVIFVTHDIAEAILLGDRIGMMSVGPRSTISRVFNVDFPRPRDLTHPKVAQLFHEIENLLAPDVAHSEQ